MSERSLLTDTPPTEAEAAECFAKRITLRELRRQQAIEAATAGPDPEQLEKAEVIEIDKVYRAFGCLIWNLSQPRHAKYLTPGLPDRWVAHIASGYAWWHEAKRPVGGRYSTAQIEFRDTCRAAGIMWVGGDRRAAEAQLIALEIAERGPLGTLEPVRR